MAREAGQYRRMLLEQQAYGSSRRTFSGDYMEDTEAAIWPRIRFYVSLVLFLAYVLLDYTGGSLYSLNSSLILAEIQKDMTHELHIDTLLAELMEQVEITEESSAMERNMEEIPK